MEVNIRKKKFLLVCTYNTNKNLISSHIREIEKNVDNFSFKCDNFILLGNLNFELTESAAFSNILLGTFEPNLVSLILSSLQILGINSGQCLMK